MPMEVPEIRIIDAYTDSTTQVATNTAKDANLVCKEIYDMMTSGTSTKGWSVSLQKQRGTQGNGSAGWQASPSGASWHICMRPVTETGSNTRSITVSEVVDGSALDMEHLQICHVAGPNTVDNLTDFDYLMNESKEDIDVQTGTYPQGDSAVLSLNHYRCAVTTTANSRDAAYGSGYGAGAGSKVIILLYTDMLAVYWQNSDGYVIAGLHAGQVYKPFNSDMAAAPYHIDGTGFLFGVPTMGQTGNTSYKSMFGQYRTDNASYFGGQRQIRCSENGYMGTNTGEIVTTQDRMSNVGGGYINASIPERINNGSGGHRWPKSLIVYHGLSGNTSSSSVHLGWGYPLGLLNHICQMVAGGTNQGNFAYKNMVASQASGNQSWLCIAYGPGGDGPDRHAITPGAAAATGGSGTYGQGKYFISWDKTVLPLF